MRICRRICVWLFVSNCLFFSLLSHCIATTDQQQAVNPAKQKYLPQLEDRQWSFLLYRGNTVKQWLYQLAEFQYTSVGEVLYSAELAYALNKNNLVIKFLHPVLNQIQFAANVAERYSYDDPRRDPVTEFDLYVMARRVNRLWQKYLNTTMAAGTGLSYTSSVPYVEQNHGAAHSSTRFLAFLTFEFTVALPSYPYLQLVGRIHHRSGVYGIFYPFRENPGSNNIGVGIRYYFR